MIANVIGLGSMGKRRIRCLKKLGITQICGLDTDVRRTSAAALEFGIKITNQIDGLYLDGIWFICTPPDKHFEYMKYCSDHGIMFFVEHGISPIGLDVIQSANCHPSCTMLFNSEIIKLKQMIGSGGMGKISNIIYHCGQYLPDWHPHENVKDYYVSKKETGGAREIVPFELTWMVDVFGQPKRISSHYGKTIDIPGAPDIDDTYNILIDWGSFFGVLTVDVVSSIPTRRLLVNGSKNRIILDLNRGIGEDMYLAETSAFLNGTLPNSLARDINILNLLKEAECA